MTEEQKKEKEQVLPSEAGATVEAKPKEDIDLIVRVADVDLDGKTSVKRALTKIKGIGVRMSENVAVIFEKETGVPGTEKLGKLSEEHVKKLEQIVLKPMEFGVPKWSLNRQKDFTTGEYTHRVMAELDLGLRQDLQRLGEIKSYRGLRHSWKLPVRGQRTKSTHRGKGSTVGVVRKEAKK